MQIPCFIGMIEKVYEKKLYTEIHGILKRGKTMSQEKVERYKKEKANRKKNMKRAKMKKSLLKAVAALVVVLAIAGAGYASYQSYLMKPVEVTADMSAFDEYVTNITAEE